MLELTDNFLSSGHKTLQCVFSATSVKWNRLARTLFSLIIIICLFVASNALAVPEKTPSFTELDRRARAGERLNVVFFGASLTWGANASDPQLTSYRGRVSQKLAAAYPKACFKFWDASIGATGSQLGVFRFERDVLRHKPDLIFLDFSANDGIENADSETLASYESLVRRSIVDGRAPVVQVILPFLGDAQKGTTDGMKRRDAHLAISQAYHTAFADAISLAQQRVKAGETSVEKLWPFDGAHPGDVGYALFADAAWDAFQTAVKQKRHSQVPTKMLNAETYLHNVRIRISSLGNLPQGWRVGMPNPVAAYFDMLMSRWLDDEVIASNKNQIINAKAKKQFSSQQVQPLQVKFRGSMVMLFGESTPKSTKYRAYIDGKLVERKSEDGRTLLEFDGAQLGALVKGNSHHVQAIATALDPNIEHTLKIEPRFSGSAEELRLESICVAGGAAKVYALNGGTNQL